MTDRRLLASNGEVAAIELRGQVSATRFVEGEICRIAVSVTDLRVDAKGTSLDRQLLYGDRFRVLQRLDCLAFGQAGRGGYVGYVPEAHLADWIEPNSKIEPRASFGFAAPDMKTPQPLRLPMGASVHVVSHDDRFAVTECGLHVPTSHLVRLDRFETDPVGVAERFLGTPYLWGGNSDLGIDCSGLVQAACLACGLDCPGDSDQQSQALGFELPDDAELQRGDLLFWKGHVAWVADADTILHANAFHMAVAFEPLNSAIARIEAQEDGPFTARKRLELPL